MKKRKHVENGKSIFSPVGGRLEPDELRHPRRACLREIREESGIREEQISDLRLQYVLLRLKGDEIRQMYVYFGSTDCRDVVESEEGELYWINRDEWVKLEFIPIVKCMIEDYAGCPSADDTVKVGVITTDDCGNPMMQWSELKDPMVD
jgi:8-oxo-dGTP diphosphatase